MNKSSDSTASSKKSAPAATEEGAKKSERDPHQLVRFVNMILALAMLVFAVWGIFSIFSTKWTQSIIISLFFSFYQM